MRRAVACLMLALAVTSCSDSGTDPQDVPDPVVAVSAHEGGDGQSATVGAQVATRPAVRVTSDGAPAAGVTVTFSVASGGGSITGGTQTTDANGVARVGGWTLGTTVGANTLTASVEDANGSPVTFQATATAGAATQLVKVEGDAQDASAGSAVSVAPAVEVRDQFGNRVAGEQVTFAVTSGGGSATDLEQTSDANGVARVGSWTLGTTAGENTLTASLGSSTVVFTATAHPLSAAQVAVHAGNTQIAPAGTAVSVRPAVRVTDTFGNPVEDVTVTFTTSSGTLTGASQDTDADGIAAVGGWTLAQLAGDNTLTATVSGDGITGNPVTFTATGIAGAPAVLTKIGDNQTASAGAAVAVAPAVDVMDQFNNKIVGFPVSFAVTGGGGTITGADATTNANGRATLGSWVLGQTAGANTLTATAGTITVTFNATGEAAGFDATPYAGTYSGTWTNTTFGSVGTGNAVVTVNPANNTVTANITVTGNVLGSGVAPSVQNATYGPNGVTFSTTHNVMGDVTVTVDDDGQVIASGINVPNAGITRWDATGTITPAQLQLNFTVTFNAGAPAVGTITLNKQ